MSGLKVTLLVAVAFGSALGLYALSALIEHHSFGELNDPQTGALDVPYAAMMFLAWFAAGFLTVALVGVVVGLVRSAISKTGKI